MNTDRVKFKGKYYTRVEVAVKILKSSEWKKIKAPVELLRDYRGTDILRVRKGTAEFSLFGFDDVQKAWANIQELLK